MIASHYGDAVVTAEARDGVEAVAAGAAFLPDVVIMDLAMPRMDGLTAISAIRARYGPRAAGGPPAATPAGAPAAMPAGMLCPRFIILTAHDEFRFAQEAVKVGVTDYLLKPIGAHELVRALETVRESLETERRRRRDEEELRSKLRAVMPVVRMEFTRDLIEGCVENDEECARRASFLGIPDLPRFALATEPASPEIGFPRAQGLIERTRAAVRALWRGDDGYLVGVSGVRLVVLAPVAAADGGDGRNRHRGMMELADEVRRTARAAAGRPVAVGVGTVYAALRDVGRSCKEAFRALDHGVFLGADQVVHVRDVEDAVAGRHQAAADLERRAVRAMRLGEVADLQEALAGFCRPWGDEPSRPGAAALRLSLVEMIVLLGRAAVEGGAKPEEVGPATREALAGAFGAGDAAEARAHLTELGRRLLRLVLAGRAARSEGFAEKAAAYVRENYAADLSLETVAGAVFVSSYYLSRIFRDRMGATFVDYLTGLRMEKARHLLRSTGLDVGEVALRVGFKDPNYFRRVFRKLEGRTPREYRQDAPR
jgi:two-component system response regulator YesN